MPTEHTSISAYVDDRCSLEPFGLGEAGGLANSISLFLFQKQCERAGMAFHGGQAAVNFTVVLVPALVSR